LINQSSLFIAAGICAAALALTMLSVWLHHRADPFMIGWTSGMLMLGLGVLIYYTLPPDNMMIVAGAFGLETVGFVIVYLSARAFVGRPMESRPGR
jgi:ABC-type Fe3+-siderophore transport system permease subunit